MSLINEALKKAQRSRGDSPDSAAVAVGEVLVAKRRPPTSAKMILLYAAGGLVAFVLCVVGAVYYLNRPAPQPPTPTPAPRPVAKAEPAATPAVNVPAPGAAAPVVSPGAPGAVVAQPATVTTTATTQGTQGTQGTAPVAVTKPEVAVPAASESKPAPAAVPSSLADTPARPAAPAILPPDTSANAPAAAAPQPAVAAKADERVQVYLETLRITAVRALGGGDSRVMMNDRVYRVNDIVERNLGLRLSKVEANQLTFTDANGVNYVKYF